MAEKNLTFNEAKNKGLVAPNKAAEQETLRLAGGQDAFRPESWWNQQLTKQINAKDFKELEGFRQIGIGLGFVGGNPNILTGTRTASNNPLGILQSSIAQYQPIYKDVTVDVLKKITQQSKQALEATRRESGEMSATRKRLSRVTGGLLAGAQAPSMGAVSSGPMLGGEDGLGATSTLGRKTRI